MALAQVQKPHFQTQGHCIIERFDNVPDDKLPLKALELIRHKESMNLPNEGDKPYGPPLCYRMCYYDEEYIRQNPVPWPVNSPNGVRPTWKNREQVDCPINAQTGEFILGPAPVFPKRVECRDAPTASDPKKCIKACKLFEQRRGVYRGVNYGGGGEWVEDYAGLIHFRIGANGEVEPLPNPPRRCGRRAATP